MRLFVFAGVLLGVCTCSPLLPAQGGEGELMSPDAGEMLYDPDNIQVSRAELLDYLAYLKQQQQLEAEPQVQTGPMKMKRYWRNSWLGNKYRDNKSYGFWITGLNKAGNRKRGKRAEPFVPGLSYQQAPYNILSPLSGYKEDLKELVPDHDYSQMEN